MEAIVLPTQSALSFGASIWILPDPQTCSWTKKMDWYLNGLISKAECRTPLELPLGLRQILREEDLALSAIPQHDGMLLISSHLFLPCRQVLVQQFSGGIKAWLKKVIEQACKTGEGPLRIFLPDQEICENACRILGELKTERSMTVVSGLTVEH